MAYNEGLTDEERRVLFCAADEIERRGWLQGFYFENYNEPKTSPVCMLGAIELCLHPELEPGAMRFISSAHLADKLIYPRGSRKTGIRWNDVRSRTKEQVIQLLRKNAS